MKKPNLSIFIKFTDTNIFSNKIFVDKISVVTSCDYNLNKLKEKNWSIYLILMKKNWFIDTYWKFTDKNIFIDKIYR